MKHKLTEQQKANDDIFVEVYKKIEGEYKTTANAEGDFVIIGQLQKVVIKGQMYNKMSAHAEGTATEFAEFLLRLVEEQPDFKEAIFMAADNLRGEEPNNIFETLQKAFPCAIIGAPMKITEAGIICNCPKCQAKRAQRSKNNPDIN